MTTTKIKERVAFGAISAVLFGAAVGAGVVASDITHRDDVTTPQKPVQTPATPKPAATVTPPPKVVTKTVTKVVTKTVTKIKEVRVPVPGPTVTKEVIKFVPSGGLLPPCPTPSGAGTNICFTVGPPGSKAAIKINSGSQTIVMW